MSPADVRNIKRRNLGQVKVRGVFPKARIGSLIGTVKSKRPVSLKKLDPLEIKSHFDVHNTVDQTQVAYFGFPDAGDQDNQMKQACYALVNMLFRRSGMKMASIDVALHDADSTPDDAGTDFFSQKLDRIILTYVHTETTGTTLSKHGTHMIDENSTIRGVGDAIFAEIKSNAYPQVGSLVSYWPHVVKLYQRDYFTSTQASIRQFAVYDLENVMVDFKYMRKYKWQNTTPAGAGGVGGSTDINDVNANPLSGKVYKFKGPVPLLRDQVKDQFGDKTNYALDLIERQGDNTTANDYLTTEAFRDLGLFTGALHAEFGQPVKANQYFKNAETEDKVYMPPGGYKQIIRQGKVTMNFKRFTQAAIYIAAQTDIQVGFIFKRPARIGTSTMWGLEPALRTTVQERVQLHVNSELWYTTKCRVANKKQPVATFNNVSAGRTFS